MDETYTIRWVPIDTRPEEASYVLVKMIGQDGRVRCEPCIYEAGEFGYFYDREDKLLFNEHSILGWSYYPYDIHS